MRMLGAGGHGSVYLVEHTFLESTAVMKVLHGDLVDRTDLAQRMTREARTLAKLRHPNIVEVRDGGLTAEKPARPYFVMEPLSGMSVRDMLRKTPSGVGILPALRIVTDILIGLDHAHAAGVIHRDIKPDNVFLHRAQPSVTVAKVLDFGIAHLLLGQRFTGRYFLGTPRYAAPEQLRGESPTARSDVYAAGLVLYELLTGEAPFANLKDIGALLNAHLNEALPAPSRRNPAVPPFLDKLLAVMVAKDPEERPPKAIAAAVMLREAYANISADQSTSIHAPDFKTEPSLMDPVLFEASPDDPPIVTEVAAPLGINDTTPDGGPQIETLRAAIAAEQGETTDEDARPRGSAVRTVPMAAVPKWARAGKPIDRAARTNTADDARAVVQRGPNDTNPLEMLDAALAETTPAPRDEPAHARGTTTAEPVALSPRPRKRRAFAPRVAGIALFVGLGAMALTAAVMRVADAPRAGTAPMTASSHSADLRDDPLSPQQPSTAPPSVEAEPRVPPVEAAAGDVEPVKTETARAPHRQPTRKPILVPSAVPFD
ncbi:MAG: protein kinase [Labilithrix sp.]|nr:protein kinase [Labilithrix sp.]